VIGNEHYIPNMMFLRKPLVNVLLFPMLAVVSACTAQEPTPASVQERSLNPDAARYRTLDSVLVAHRGQRFAVVVLKDTIEQPEGFDAAVRPLLLYRYLPDGKRELLARNDSLVLCQGCGGIHGDPYEDITFENDTLRISHYGGSSWRWDVTQEFVPVDGPCWPLTRVSRSSYWSLAPDSTLKVTEGPPDIPTDLCSCNVYQ